MFAIQGNDLYFLPWEILSEDIRQRKKDELQEKVREIGREIGAFHMRNAVLTVEEGAEDIFFTRRQYPFFSSPDIRISGDVFSSILHGDEKSEAFRILEKELSTIPDEPEALALFLDNLPETSLIDGLRLFAATNNIFTEEEFSGVIAHEWGHLRWSAYAEMISLFSSFSIGMLTHPVFAIFPTIFHLLASAYCSSLQQYEESYADGMATVRPCYLKGLHRFFKRRLVLQLLAERHLENFLAERYLENKEGKEISYFWFRNRVRELLNQTDPGSHPNHAKRLRNCYHWMHPEQTPSLWDRLTGYLPSLAPSPA